MIQIQHLLKLNKNLAKALSCSLADSNTTFVKVKYFIILQYKFFYIIQIQHLLKLNNATDVTTK